MLITKSKCLECGNYVALYAMNRRGPHIVASEWRELGGETRHQCPGRKK